MRHRLLLPALAAAAVLALATPASAHVTVSADDTSQGADDSVLTFRVPNEMSAALTTKVEFTFPTSGTPLASVSPAPKQGWTITTKTTKFASPITTDDGTISEGVSDVTYTAAAGGGIPVGDFDTFQVLVGPLPAVASLQFPTLQTYSNGKTVSWIQPNIAGQDVDNPAPLLALTAGDAADASPSASAAPSVVAAPAPAASSSSSSGVADTALVLGIVGVLLGLGGVGFGIASRRKA